MRVVGAVGTVSQGSTILFRNQQRMCSSFRVPNGRELHEVEGRVVWSRDGSDEAGMERAPGMGIQFTDRVAAAKLARELDDLE